VRSIEAAILNLQMRTYAHEGVSAGRIGEGITSADQDLVSFEETIGILKARVDSIRSEKHLLSEAARRAEPYHPLHDEVVAHAFMLGAAHPGPLPSIPDEDFRQFGAGYAPTASQSAGSAY
jgi:hypothetical protein